jgi:hypothetical protein
MHICYTPEPSCVQFCYNSDGVFMYFNWTIASTVFRLLGSLHELLLEIVMNWLSGQRSCWVLGEVLWWGLGPESGPTDGDLPVVSLSLSRQTPYWRRSSVVSPSPSRQAPYWRRSCVVSHSLSRQTPYWRRSSVVSLSLSRQTPYWRRSSVVSPSLSRQTPAQFLNGLPQFCLLSRQINVHWTIYHSLPKSEQPIDITITLNIGLYIWLFVLFAKCN